MNGFPTRSRRASPPDEHPRARSRTDQRAGRRVDVLGVGISTVTPEMALDVLAGWIERRERHFVCVTGVHGVMESQRDPALLHVHNASGLTVPDGMPMVWACHRAGADWVSRVYGPDLMRAACAAATTSGWRMFLYGATPRGPRDADGEACESCPGVQIVGAISPPFRRLSDAERRAIVAEINSGRTGHRVGGAEHPEARALDAREPSGPDAPVLVGVGRPLIFSRD